MPLRTAQMQSSVRSLVGRFQFVSFSFVGLSCIAAEYACGFRVRFRRFVTSNAFH